MTSVNVNSLWHIRLEFSKEAQEFIESTGIYRCSRLDVFNYLLWKKSKNWPYLVHKDDSTVNKDLKIGVCGYCNGKVWVYPFTPQQVKVLKVLAVQLGFRVKIMTFSKHNICVRNRPTVMNTNLEGVTFVN